MGTIRRILPDDVDAYTALWLEAVEACPLAFLTSSADVMSTPRQRYVKQLENQYLLGYFDTDLCAMLGVRIEEREKLRHKAHIGPMYVKPAHSRKGIARALMQDALQYCKEENVEMVYLGFAEGNQPAKKLYESIGFACYGKEPKALKHSGQYYDNNLMYLAIEA